MHKPSDAPRRSIYYNYRVYPFRVPREIAGEAKRWTVAVVGAGPAGLITALELARFGIEVVLLEAERQVAEGSRAIVFTRRTLEVLQDVGVAEQVTEKGLAWRYGTSFYRGRPVFRMDAPHDVDDRFQPLTNLQQQYLEQYLVERTERERLIELRWANKVTAVVSHEDCVRLRVDTPAGEYLLEADWVVAADGARSPLRGMLGLTMAGDSYEGLFVIADIRVDLDFPTERRAYFDPPWNPGNSVLMHREPDDIWRIDFRLPDGESVQEALDPTSLAARIDAQLAMVGCAGRSWELDWCSVYSARAITLADFCAGRVAFVGDAAHLLPIFGVRGANTGAQDAQNLAWKLALVARGRAPRALLHSYSEERVAAAREIIAEAGRSTRFMTPPTRGFRLMRDATLSLALSEQFVRPLLHWRTSRAHHYLGSSLNAADDDDALFDSGPERGAPLRNVQLSGGDFLFDHLGAAFHLISVNAPPDAHGFAAALGLRESGVAVRFLALVADPGRAVPHADLVCVDAEGRAAARLGAGERPAYLLVRPDQHVCARFRSLEPRRLAAALARALARP